MFIESSAKPNLFHETDDSTPPCEPPNITLSSRGSDGSSRDTIEGRFYVYEGGSPGPPEKTPLDSASSPWKVHCSLYRLRLLIYMGKRIDNSS